MKVFKFGGASVKDADGVRNVYDVLQKVGYDDVLIVVSAMGKTTNALEVVIKDYFDKSKSLQASVQEVKKYHNQIILDLKKSVENLDGFVRTNKEKIDKNVAMAFLAQVYLEVGDYEKAADFAN